MGANSTGIAGTPEQIADGKNPKIKVTVVALPNGTNALLVEGATGGTNPGGQPVPQALGWLGGTILDQAAVFRALLIEARVHSYLLATGLSVTDDLNQLRIDVAADIGPTDESAGNA